MSLKQERVNLNHCTETNPGSDFALITEKNFPTQRRSLARSG